MTWWGLVSLDDGATLDSTTDPVKGANWEREVREGKLDDCLVHIESESGGKGIVAPPT